MVLPDNWPAGLRSYLTQRVGEPLHVTALSGAGGPGAYRAAGPEGDVIVKGDQPGREARFYQQVAPELRRRGIGVPELYWASRDGSLQWLVLEAIPQALPRTRWTADPEVMRTLARLHGSPRDVDLGGLQPYRPQWGDEITEAAVSCMPAAQAGAVRSALRAAQERSQGLFAPACLISGDPNPTNWGVRADGSVVLFDWERFGHGSPAIDVAITIPGFPSADGAAERQVAAGYLEQWKALYGEPFTSVDLFTADIRRAKLWSAVEFVAAYAEGTLAEHARATGEQAAAWLADASVPLVKTLS